MANIGDGDIVAVIDADAKQYLLKLQGVEEATEDATDNMERSYKKVGSEADRVSNKVDRQTDKFRKLKKVGKIALKALAVAAASAAAAIGTGVVKLARFNREMGQVATLVGGAEAKMAQFREGVEQIAQTTPESSSVLNEALYQTVSAGITDASSALTVLNTASKAAVAGATDTKIAVDGITTAINAFNRDATDARDIADSFFVAIREGKTTMEELSAQIGEAAPMAAELGISLESVLGATAALTKSGLSTSKAMNALQGVFGEMLKPTGKVKEAAREMGVQFGRAAFESQSFLQWIKKIAQQSEKTGVGIEKLTGEEEALNALLQLTSQNGADFANIMGEMDQKAGAMQQAFEVMNSRLTSISKLLRNQLMDAFRNLGAKALPSVRRFMESVIDYFEDFESPANQMLTLLKEINAEAEQIGKQRQLTNLLDARRRIRNLQSTLATTGSGGNVAVGIQGIQKRTWGDFWNKIFAGPSQNVFQRATKAISNLFTGREFNTQFDFLDVDPEQLQNIKGVRNLLDTLDKKAVELSSNLRQLQQRQIRLNLAGEGLTKQQQRKLQGYEKIVRQIEFYRKRLEQLMAALRREKQLEEDISARLAGPAPDRSFFERLTAPITGQTKAGMLMQGTTQRRQVGTDFSSGQVSADFSRIRENVKNAAVVMREYRQQVRRLKAEYFTTNMSQQEFRKEMQDLSNVTRQQLIEDLKDMKDSAGANKKQIQALIDALEKLEDQGKESGESLDDTLDNAIDAMDTMLNMVDQLGKLPEAFDNAAQGAVDMLRHIKSISNLSKGAGFLAVATPVIGAASGLVTIISSLVQSTEKQVEQMKSLSEQMRDFEESLSSSIAELNDSIRDALGGEIIAEELTGMQRQFAQTLMSGFQRRFRFAQAMQGIQSVVGAQLAAERGVQPFTGFDVSGERLTRIFEAMRARGVPRPQAKNIIDAIEEDKKLSDNQLGLLESILNELRDAGFDAESMQKEFGRMLQDLADKGIISEQMKDSFAAAYDQLIEKGVAPIKAIERIMEGNVKGLDKGLQQFIDTITEQAGAFGKGLDGIITKMNFFAKRLDAGVNKQLDMLINGLVENVDNINMKFQKQLSDLIEGDTKKAELERFISRLEELKGEGETPGGLSAEQRDQLLAALRTILGRFGEGDTAKNKQFSRSVQFERSITSVQAEEQLVFLQAIERWNRRQTHALEKIARITGRQGALAGQRIARQNVNIDVSVNGNMSAEELSRQIHQRFNKEMTTGF